MVKINYEYLEIDHIVDFVHDATVFAAARENGNGGHMRIFLINEATGRVYTRNGMADSWEQLYGSERDTIIARLVAARNRNVPVYRINGSGSSN